MRPLAAEGPVVTVAHAYLPQLFAMVALSFAIAVCILVTRVRELITGRKAMAYYEDWDGTGASPAVMRPTRQLANLFEFPVLFYTVIVLIIVLGLRDPWLAGFATTYVALRWAHAMVHLAFNRLWVRTPIFMLGQFLLLGLWVRFGILAYS